MGMNRFFEQTRRLACELADMDWARDAAGITDSDYQNVYKYEEKPTTIVRMTDGEQEPSVLTLESEEDWASWLQSVNVSYDISRMVLIHLHRRSNPVQMDRSLAMFSFLRNDQESPYSPPHAGSGPESGLKHTSRKCPPSLEPKRRRRLLH